MDRNEFYLKIDDQFHYLFNLWSTQAPFIEGFLRFYEKEIAKEATKDIDQLQPWRLRSLKQIEDEMPAVIVKYINRNGG